MKASTRLQFAEAEEPDRENQEALPLRKGLDGAPLSRRRTCPELAPCRLDADRLSWLQRAGPSATLDKRSSVVGELWASTPQRQSGPAMWSRRTLRREDRSMGKARERQADDGGAQPDGPSAPGPRPLENETEASCRDCGHPSDRHAGSPEDEF